MAPDMSVEITSFQWIFRPLSQRGALWLAMNLFGGELRIRPQGGPNAVRAMRADGLTLAARTARSVHELETIVETATSSTSCRPLTCSR